MLTCCSQVTEVPSTSLLLAGKQCHLTNGW